MASSRGNVNFRKLDHTECVNLHRDLATYVEEHVAIGPLHALGVATFGNSPIEQGYMSVPLLNMPAGNITSISDKLKSWRPGTSIYDERDPTTQVMRHIIDVPILVKRKAQRSYDDGDDGDGNIPFNDRRASARVHHRRNPSSKWAMVYLMLLAMCVIVLFFMEAIGSAPQFLMSWKR
jgi:hypothetical protein